jgi:predicted nucleic acid-binding protein
MTYTTGRVFLDTNILIYADDLDSPEKRATALSLLDTCFRKRSGVLSTQVLQEFFAISVKKLGVAAADARRKVELLSSLEVFPIGVEDILGAIDLHRLHGYSFWDSLILRAALESGCTVCYTEDLDHGRQIGCMKIVNPFLEGKKAEVREKAAAYRAGKLGKSAKRRPRTP